MGFLRLAKPRRVVVQTREIGTARDRFRMLGGSADRSGFELPYRRRGMIDLSST
jgi:hypothetical protein